jgi:fucose 4-O-acetylase-like acetyltransferase
LSINPTQALTPALSQRERERTPRVDAIDYAKGIGILLVVIAHVWRGLENANLPLPQPAFAAMDRWVYGFHMPLFFFASGLFLFRSAAKPAGTYLIEKASTIVWPYLVWSVVYWQLSSMGSGGTKLSTGAFARAIAIEPIGHLWFLWVLFAIGLAMLALRKLKLPAWVVFVVSIGVWYAAKRGVHLWVAQKTGLAIDGPLFQFAMFFPYVAAAGAIAPLLMKALASWPMIVWAMLSIFGAGAVTWLTRSGGGNDHMFNFASGAAGIVMVLGLARILEHDKITSIRFLGERSLEIYLVHILAAAAARMALLKLTGVTTWWVHLSVGLTAGVLVPLAIWWVCRTVRCPLPFRWPVRASSKGG